MVPKCPRAAPELLGAPGAVLGAPFGQAPRGAALTVREPTSL